MANEKKGSLDDFDEANADALAEILADPATSEPVRLGIINEILSQAGDQNFFETMFTELMTLAKCPHCAHENHFLIPEDDLNQFGWVTHEKDDRVPVHTTKIECKEFSEACLKKKTTI